MTQNQKWKTIRPKTIEEVKASLKHPLSHTRVVLCKVEDKMSMLNPFGGGMNNTQELKLDDSFKITEKILGNIIIIDYCNAQVDLK